VISLRSIRRIAAFGAAAALASGAFTFTRRRLDGQRVLVTGG
jgi:hypothetical protein